MFSISDLISITAILSNCFLVILFTWLYQNMSSKERHKKDYYLSEIHRNKSVFFNCLDKVLQNEGKDFRLIKSDLLLLASQLAYNLQETNKAFNIEIDNSEYLFITNALLKLEEAPKLPLSKRRKTEQIKLNEDLIEDIHDQYFLAIQGYNKLILQINNKHKLLW